MSRNWESNFAFCPGIRRPEWSWSAYIYIAIITELLSMFVAFRPTMRTVFHNITNVRLYRLRSATMYMTHFDEKPHVIQQSVCLWLLVRGVNLCTRN